MRIFGRVETLRITCFVHSKPGKKLRREFKKQFPPSVTMISSLGKKLRVDQVTTTKWDCDTVRVQLSVYCGILIFNIISRNRFDLRAWFLVNNTHSSLICALIRQVDTPQFPPVPPPCNFFVWRVLFHNSTGFPCYIQKLIFCFA